MNIIKIILFFTFPSIAIASELNLRFQKDLFIQKNICGIKRTAFHSAIFVNFETKKKNLKGNVTFYLEDKKSGFEQLVIFNQKNYFYPNLFGSQGHKEYELPHCPNKGSLCEVGFFVFDHKNILAGKEVNFDLKLFSMDLDHKLIESFSTYQTHKVPPATQDHAYLFEDSRLELSKKNYFGWVNKDKVKTLLKNQYEIQILFHWRKNANQQQYFEQSINLNQWLNSSDNSIKFLPQNEIAYLSLLVFVIKDSFSYETKLEVMNTKNPFYDCK